ncbi:Protein of unknown function [Gryllus bimaculatus]|nr:Protein of unknown function [Gryllus bimaculatus]
MVRRYDVNIAYLLSQDWCQVCGIRYLEHSGFGTASLSLSDFYQLMKENGFIPHRQFYFPFEYKAWSNQKKKRQKAGKSKSKYGGAGRGQAGTSKNAAKKGKYEEYCPFRKYLEGK